VIASGCYFAVPARFSEDTDSGFEMSANSFGGDSASFGIVSLPYDEEVPVIPGATQYGFVEWSSAVKSLDSREAHWYSYTGTVATQAYLPSTGYYPLGGPHFRIINNGTQSITLVNSSGGTAATITTAQAAMVFVKETAAGVRIPAVVLYTKA
jgi:hypothetical protein